MGSDRENPPYSIEDIQRLRKWDHQYVWHPFTQMQDYVKQEPLIIARAEGAYLYDIKGKRYFDGNSHCGLICMDTCDRK